MRLPKNFCSRKLNQYSQKKIMPTSKNFLVKRIVCGLPRLMQLLVVLVYRHCWDILGDSLTEMVKAVLSGASPSLSQGTSLMVYGAKNNKPPNSTNPDHKRRISLLNADF